MPEFKETFIQVKIGHYRHYQGQSVKVMVSRIVRHFQTKEPSVLVEAIDGEFYTIPWEHFHGEVEVEGRMVKRFTHLDDLLEEHKQQLLAEAEQRRQEVNKRVKQPAA